VLLVLLVLVLVLVRWCGEGVKWRAASGLEMMVQCGPSCIDSNRRE
jgi:hypothetical protein